MSKKRSGSIADDETFVNLIHTAQEDPEVGDRLRTILALDSFNRRSLLNTWLEELGLQNAPADFIRALSYLLDDEVARTASELL